MFSWGELTGALDAGKCADMASPDRRARIARIGRRLGILVFAIPVAAATALWTSQILRQVFWPEPGALPSGCRTGVLALDQAIRRARRAAADEPNGERPALARFREALSPEWKSREALASACRGDRPALDALAELDALRYAEEHAVRYEAVALAKQRRRSDAIRRELGAPPPAK
jgi:hypothetical protein